MDKFFLRMAAIYPYKWAGQFPNADAVMIAKEEWHDALSDLSLDDIKNGLDHCRKNGGDFPPSIPEFRKMCLPTDDEMGILPEEEAYYQLSHENYSNPIVDEVSRRIDLYNWKLMPVKEARKVFFRIYQLCVDNCRIKYLNRKRFHDSLPDLTEKPNQIEKKL